MTGSYGQSATKKREEGKRERSNGGKVGVQRFGKKTIEEVRVKILQSRTGKGRGGGDLGGAKRL